MEATARRMPVSELLCESPFNPRLRQENDGREGPIETVSGLPGRRIPKSTVAQTLLDQPTREDTAEAVSKDPQERVSLPEVPHPPQDEHCRGDTAQTTSNEPEKGVSLTWPSNEPEKGVSLTWLLEDQQWTIEMTALVESMMKKWLFFNIVRWNDDVVLQENPGIKHLVDLLQPKFELGPEDRWTPELLARLRFRIASKVIRTRQRWAKQGTLEESKDGWHLVSRQPPLIRWHLERPDAPPWEHDVPLLTRQEWGIWTRKHLLMGPPEERADVIKWWKGFEANDTYRAGGNVKRVKRKRPVEVDK